MPRKNPIFFINEFSKTYPFSNFQLRFWNFSAFSRFSTFLSQNQKGAQILFKILIKMGVHELVSSL